jgi:hypothetical protein
MEKHAALARKFYSRSVKFPKLDLISQGNSALLDHWMGESDQAIERLEGLLSLPINEENAPFVVQGAIVLLETGQLGTARDALYTIPEKLRSPLANRLLASMGVRQ